LGRSEVEAFLSWLANERKVSASTHRQALAALQNCSMLPNCTGSRLRMDYLFTRVMNEMILGGFMRPGEGVKVRPYANVSGLHGRSVERLTECTLGLNLTEAISPKES
jgi:Phage integrase, N-terminal SAM-like domain